MTTALVVPDPRNSPVPVGWFEDVAMPALASIETWEGLDEAEGSLRAVVSFVECYDGDALEYEKALRMLEKRRGELAGTKGSMHGSDSSPATVSRWRSIAEHWDDIVFPALSSAKTKWDATQSKMLRLINPTKREPKRWYATDEITHEAQEIYDYRTKVADPYAMAKTLEHVVNNL